MRVQPITQQVYLTMYIEDEMYYMFRPDPAIIRYISKSSQRIVTIMYIYEDVEISSSGFNYVIVKN